MNYAINNTSVIETFKGSKCARLIAIIISAGVIMSSTLASAQDETQPVPPQVNAEQNSSITNATVTTQSATAVDAAPVATNNIESNQSQTNILEAFPQEDAQNNPNERSDIPHDLSPWGMYEAADWVVKSVMIGLVAASVLTWTVFVAKSLQLLGAGFRARATLKIVTHARNLEEAITHLGNKAGPSATMIRMARREMALSDAIVNHTDGSGIKERVTSVLNRIEVHAGRRMARGTGVLATIGSVSPFVGLFGTVWGIMNSFISISESQTTNLAIVAPGIAEALLATAIGLVAAIPAVVIYNIFARAITGYRHQLADVASGVERLVSRDLDFRLVSAKDSSQSSNIVGH